MSLPIKDTPILKGKEAKRFFEEIEENKDKRISEEERNRINKNFEFMIKIFRGNDARHI